MNLLVAITQNDKTSSFEIIYIRDFESSVIYFILIMNDLQ